MRALLLRGLLFGALAGLLAAVFSFVVGEPVLDRAIGLEGPVEGEPLVSRETQKAFLFVAQPVVGASLGVLLAVAYALVPRDVRLRPFGRALLVAAGAFTALYLVPFLVYPPSPPGVGDPDTVGGRTSSYLLALAVGIAVVTGSYAATRALAARGLDLPARSALVAVGAVAVVAVTIAVLPDGEAAPDALPADLLWDFRLASLGLQLVLWSVLGAGFGWATERAERLATAPAGAAA